MSNLGFGFEIKSIDEAGYIAGIAAGYGNMDHGGDVIMPGALTKAIAGRSSVPMLLYHDHKQPVGAWSKFDETSDGLNVEGKIAIKSDAGRNAHALAEAGALPGLSIGYRTLRHKFEGKARQLHELDLHEVSLVPIGMNSRAVVTDVKSASGAADWLKKAIRLHRAHMDGSEPTSDASQMRMMEMMDKALAELSDDAAPPSMRMGGKTLPMLPDFEDFLREAGFSKTQATAIAGKGLAQLLRGEPDSSTDLTAFLRGIQF